MRLTEALDLALQGSGVHAFDVAPGVVDTPMTRSMEMWRDFTDWTPPERVVELVAAIAAGELDAWAGGSPACKDDLDEIRAVTPGRRRPSAPPPRLRGRDARLTAAGPGADEPRSAVRAQHLLPDRAADLGAVLDREPVVDPAQIRAFPTSRIIWAADVNVVEYSTGGVPLTLVTVYEKPESPRSPSITMAMAVVPQLWLLG